MARAHTSLNTKQHQFENKWTLVLRDPAVGEAIRHAISKYCPTESQKSAMADQLEGLFMQAAKLAGQMKESDLEAPAPAQLDPISLLKKQGAERHDKLIESGQLVTADILAKMLSVTTKAISKALFDNRIFFVASRGVRNFFPVFFADPQYDRRQIEAVSKTMGDVPGSAKYAFFVTPKLTLDGKTPLEALAEGQLNKVLQAAQGFIER